MNGIQEAVTAITAEQLGQLLASAVPIVIGIFATFIVLKLAKRLLAQVDEPMEEHPDDSIDADGQVWEDGIATGTYAEEDDELPDGWNLANGGYINDGIEYDSEGVMLGEYEDYVPAIKQAVQDAIDTGDFQHADDLCNEHGFDKLEFEWH